ncbi:MAG: PepSY-like domain-containing protein, partial [Bacteroidetes bacterium]|nr:PepSY-like domain-containing protein [Bacteroidota bacterium]
KEMAAVYNAAGVLKETEWEIKNSELPASVSGYVKQHYKGAAIKEAAKIKKSTGEVVFEAEVNKKDLIFDESGKFLRVEEDKED